MNDVPTIDTGRLLLCPPQEAEHQPLAVFLGGERSEVIGGPESLWSAWRDCMANIGHWHLHGFGLWTIKLKSNQQAIGRTGILNPSMWREPELGWHLFDGHEGHGYAYEATLAARTHAYDQLKLAPLASYIESQNTRSIALAERLGAKFEADTTLMGQPVQLYRHPKPEGA